jgi:hypothetical protein
LARTVSGDQIVRICWYNGSSVPELSPSSINTDVRRHGLNPFLTGVTVGIIAFISGFLIAFAYLVVSYLRYLCG